jgi:hypothetical protein
MKGKIIKFIRKGGRIIPISEKKVQEKLVRSQIDRGMVDSFIAKKKGEQLTFTEGATLESMKRKADKKVGLIKGIKKRNDLYKSNLKVAGSGFGLGVISSIMAFGKKEKKK